MFLLFRVLSLYLFEILNRGKNLHKLQHGQKR